MEPMFKKKRTKLGLKEYARLCAKVFESAGWKCEFCGRMTGLSCHHLTFRSAGGGDEEENLVAVCQKCHNMIHEGELRQVRSREAFEEAKK